MKRLAVLFAAVGLWPATPAPAADAPTTPSVPKPVVTEGLFGPECGQCETGTCPTGKCGPRVLPRIGDALGGLQRRGTAGPATPLPPLPAGVADQGGACVGGNCTSGNCGVAHGGMVRGGGARSCWEKVKGWVCYRQTPNHLPCKPTPYIPPQYILFQCQERGLCAGGCGPQGCGPQGVGGAAVPAGGVVADGPVARDRAIGNGRLRGQSCAPASAGGEVPAGFRFAAPEAPKVAGGTAPMPPPVVETSYRKPNPPKNTTPSIFPGLGSATNPQR